MRLHRKILIIFIVVAVPVALVMVSQVTNASLSERLSTIDAEWDTPDEENSASRYMRIHV